MEYALNFYLVCIQDTSKINLNQFKILLKLKSKWIMKI